MAVLLTKDEQLERCRSALKVIRDKCGRYENDAYTDTDRKRFKMLCDLALHGLKIAS